MKLNRSYALSMMPILLFITCCSQNSFKSILPDDFELQEGDIVFRRGGGLTSRIVLAADADGNYSHIGIVVDSAGAKMIVHAVPGEPDFKGDADRVKMDSPEHFFSTEFTVIGEVCRTNDSTIARKAAMVAMSQYRKGLLFDHDYDDEDSTKMYCTELVAFAFRKAGLELLGKERHKVSLPFIKAECIFPSDIYCSEYIESVCQFEDHSLQTNYKKQRL